MWSNWTRILLNDELNNDDTITETRTRFVCTVPLRSDRPMAEIKSEKIIYRICNNKRNDCHETGN
jgi:hypothetical protein